jgi:preprotein translocase subunit SecE
MADQSDPKSDTERSEGASADVSADANVGDARELSDASEGPLTNEMRESGAFSVSPVAEPEFAPNQLGFQRYVYAAYLTLGVGVAFLSTKIVAGIWHLLQKRYPNLGDPRDEWIYPIAIALGTLVPLYLWRKESSRQYAEEVAEELSKVTWPNKKEVTNSTTIVVVTTIVATVFFALLDQFWRFVTDKVYGIG